MARCSEDGEIQWISFAGHEFPSSNLTIVCSHVIAGEYPFQVAHDEDGLVQVFCSRIYHHPSAAQPVGLAHVVEMLEGLGMALPTVPPGHYAEFEAWGWRILKTPIVGSD